MSGGDLHPKGPAPGAESKRVPAMILGAGLAGLAAANTLGKDAIVLEKESRPGGLARTECFSGFWFDHVLHLLYFADERTESRIRGLLGDILVPCSAESWVETPCGAVRYPFQMHLGGLKEDVTVRGLRDLASAAFGPAGQPAANFEEVLLQTFGREMCQVFLFPYNRKVWKRPLSELSPSGFQWTITRPDFEDVLRGALRPARQYSAYNAKGWYPRPHAGAPVRGMEILSRALASQVPHLYLDHTVTAIGPDQKRVHATYQGKALTFEYSDCCLSTLPLPNLMRMCQGVPRDLLDACARLRYNRVISVMLSVRGPRPKDRGHWRYYSDETVIFTRLIYMHQFDPESAPAHGWGLMAEVTQRAEDPFDEAEVRSRVLADVARVGAIADSHEVVDTHIVIADPAYVVFTPEGSETVKRCIDFLTQRNIMPLGRYGRWEYSSMAQVMRDGFACADSIRSGNM